MDSLLSPDGPKPPTKWQYKRSRPAVLRNGSFIIPSTGERVRRQITLRIPSSHNESSSTAGAPLHQGSYSRASNFGATIDDMHLYVGQFLKWLQTPVSKGILKCSLAYLLGSMGTFLPPLERFLGHQDGKHIVATITVYFHPARSAGSMSEAALLGLCAVLYATFVGISSMAVSVFFETQLDLIEIAYALVLVVFCGGGLGFVGWFKQAFNSPLVGVACSLTSLAIITIITKENAVQTGVFSNDKIVQVMKMTILGITSTTAINLLLWPVSARTELRNTMIKATDSIGDMFTMITGAFLSGSESELESGSLNRAQKNYKSAFTELTKNLREAKFEHYILGTERQYKLELSLVNCIERLSQSIGGLRSAATTQFSLLKETSMFSTSTSTTDARDMSQSQEGSPFSSKGSRHDRFAVLTAIEEASEEGSGAEDHHVDEQLSIYSNVQRTDTIHSMDSSNLPFVRTPPEIFSRYIMHLGPSMKSLAYTLSEILQDLPFGKGLDYAISINEHFGSSLSEALNLYSSARADALKHLYQSKELDRERPESIEADFEEVAASCGHFSFSLQAFAHEMQNFMEILGDLKEESDNKHRSWNWLKFWRVESKIYRVTSSNTEEEESLIQQSFVPEIPKTIPNLVLKSQTSRKWSIISQAAPDLRQTLSYRVWSLIMLLFRDDIRFAIKVGIGASLYALFAFIPATRPFYQHWRGEWGLLSYMLVCSMTIGASNTTGWSRFIGTFLGATLSVLVWYICQGSPFKLAFCGWLVSIPCFYIIVAKGEGPFGRFIMLAYNLSCLYAYSLSVKDADDDDDEGGVVPLISEIALHRIVAVSAGVLWGLIITRLIWPISARTKFQDGLSLLWLRMGLIWKRDPLATLLEGESSMPYMNICEEFALQRYLLRLDTLRASAVSEFELRGAFPASEFGRILDSTRKMLDSFHAINMVIQRNLKATEGEELLLRYTAEERAQLCSRISHLFQVLASSLKLEYPLNDALPNTNGLRDRLLAKIFQYRKENADADERGQVVPTDEHYELLYAYILVTGQLADEIRKVEKEIEHMYGVMDEDLLRLQ